MQHLKNEYLKISEEPHLDQISKHPSVSFPTEGGIPHPKLNTNGYFHD